MLDVIYFFVDVCILFVSFCLLLVSKYFFVFLFIIDVVYEFFFSYSSYLNV